MVNLEKRHCTVKLTILAYESTFLPLGTFCGKGLRIDAAEKKQWDRRIKVAFQSKAWCDEAFMKRWVQGNWNNVFHSPPAALRYIKYVYIIYTYISMWCIIYISMLTGLKVFIDKQTWIVYRPEHNANGDLETQKWNKATDRSQKVVEKNRVICLVIMRAPWVMVIKC